MNIFSKIASPIASVYDGIIYPVFTIVSSAFLRRIVSLSFAATSQIGAMNMILGHSLKVFNGLIEKLASVLLYTVISALHNMLSVVLEISLRTRYDVSLPAFFILFSSRPSVQLIFCTLKGRTISKIQSIALIVSAISVCLHGKFLLYTFSMCTFK